MTSRTSAGRINFANVFLQAVFAHGADLINRNFTWLTRALALHATRPGRVQLAGEGAHHHGFNAQVHRVGADDQYGARFGDSAALRGV
jgi:pyruvate dehydrogenase complex dehydrogenase (E1) component